MLSIVPWCACTQHEAGGSRHTPGSEHVLQEFEGASRQDDDVKAKIWVARNEARYELWLQESTAHKQKQQQLQTHILHTMRQAQAAERDAMVSANVSKCCLHFSAAPYCSNVIADMLHQHIPQSVTSLVQYWLLNTCSGSVLHKQHCVSSQLFVVACRTDRHAPTVPVLCLLCDGQCPMFQASSNCWSLLSLACARGCCSQLACTFLEVSTWFTLARCRVPLQVMKETWRVWRHSMMHASLLCEKPLKEQMQSWKRGSQIHCLSVP